jgi:regulator of sigma E protease
VGEVGTLVASLPAIAQSISQHGGSGVAGPIGIARATTETVQNAPSQGGIDSVLWFVAFLSANLGVLNLLPIPALDGGRIVFVLISWIRRRNLDPEVEGLIHMVGMAALLMLIVLVSYQDVLRWVAGGSF